jgi:hypothetical protein
MKMSQHIFALNRNEQRVVIIIMLCLLLAAAGKRYYDRQMHPVTPLSPVSSGAKPASAADEEPAVPDEAR